MTITYHWPKIQVTSCTHDLAKFFRVTSYPNEKSVAVSFPNNSQSYSPSNITFCSSNVLGYLQTKKFLNRAGHRHGTASFSNGTPRLLSKLSKPVISKQSHAIAQPSTIDFCQILSTAKMFTLSPMRAGNLSVVLKFHVCSHLHTSNQYYKK